MDYPLSESWRLLDLLVVLDGIEVTLIDVTCTLEERERRERLRGDRPLGLAASQHVFEHGDRDLVVDTTIASSQECAELVVRLITSGSAPSAFTRLHRRLIAPR